MKRVAISIDYAKFYKVFQVLHKVALLVQKFYHPPPLACPQGVFKVVGCCPNPNAISNKIN